MALTFVAAWLTVRRRPGGWIVDRLATIPLVFPGLVLGIAVMQLFLHLPIPLYGTVGILIWAFVINYLPYGMRYSASGMLQIHRELEESAGKYAVPRRSSGCAGSWRRCSLRRCWRAGYSSS